MSVSKAQIQENFHTVSMMVYEDQKRLDLPGLPIFRPLIYFRCLQEIDYYRINPTGATLNGFLQSARRFHCLTSISQMEAQSVQKYGCLSRGIVIDAMPCVRLWRLTLEFYGAVQPIKGPVEGMAVGFNKIGNGRQLLSVVLH
jgi:hypothetical protein